MVAGDVRLEISRDIAYLTLSRPEKRNSMTFPMWQAVSAYTEVVESGDVRAVVIRGDGGTFSTGADLVEVLDATRSVEAATRYCVAVLEALIAVATWSVPVLTIVDGVAAGGGTELALASDIRIGTPSSRIGMPLGRLGLVPDSFSSQLLVAAVGRSAARFILLTGQLFDAATCLRLGLLHHVVPEEELTSVLSDLLDHMRRASPRALSRMKAMMVEVPSDRRAAVVGMIAAFTGGDVAERVTQFLSGIALDDS